MTVTAHVTPIWKKQKLFVGVFLLLFGAWFFWDGAVGYPRTNARYTAWQQHRASDWPAYAQSQGWKVQPPEHAMTDAQIIGQYVYGGLATLSGLIVLIYWSQQVRRILQMDDDGVITPAGTRVPFAAITGLGLKKWEAKGLATVRYEVNGRAGQFLVDDYKFDTDPCRAIVEEIKHRLEAKSAG